MENLGNTIDSIVLKMSTVCLKQLFQSHFQISVPFKNAVWVLSF